MKIFCVFLFSLFIFTAPLAAQTVSLEEELKAMRSQMAAMQEKINALEGKITQQNETLLAPVKRTAQPQAGQQWLPQIGVVADVVAQVDSADADEEGADRVSVRELELILGSDVDPYSRLDATVAFSDFEDPSLEEAYLTRFGLPAEMTARFGKFKPKVGKALAVHRDSLETVDEPLVIQKYFGVEGFSKSGLDFSKTFHGLSPLTHQMSLGVLEGGNGEEGTAFGETRRRPTLYGHLKNYLDVNDTTGFELGVSHMMGSRDEDSSFEVRVLGLDGTLTHQISANQQLKLQGEAFRLSRRESYTEVDDGLGGTTLADADDDFWGAYSLADLRFHRQWSTGLRYDYVEPVDFSSGEEGYTGYLTFHQSEFARWRAQFTHTDKIEGKDDNAVYLQGTFSIGEHKHKLQ